MKPLDIGDTVLSLRNVSVSYQKKARLFGGKPGESCVLEDITLDIQHGDSIGVLGGNGAGKSTLLKTLGGLINPDNGIIVSETRRISLLAIQAGFIPYLSGRNNSILSGLLMGMSRSEMAGCIEEIKEFSGLGERFEDAVNCYSAGMKSRLGFSTSVNIDPDVLLIDEILAVGDAEFKKKSQGVIQEKINSDKTIVLVSHSTDLIQRCCNRAIWLEKGRLLMDGTVDEVVEAYNNK